MPQTRTENSPTELSDLIKRLETRADEGLARLTFAGRVLSKSKEDLHLAVKSGILAIPFSEIEEVAPRVSADPALVWVAVRNADRVRHLLRAEQLLDAGTSTQSGDLLAAVNAAQVDMMAGGGGHVIRVLEMCEVPAYTPSGCPPNDDATDGTKYTSCWT
jgi:hypothetical protein